MSEVLACKGVGPLQNPGSHADLGTSTDPSLPSCSCLGLEERPPKGYVVLATVMEPSNHTRDLLCVQSESELPSPSPNLLCISHL